MTLLEAYLSEKIDVLRLQAPVCTYLHFFYQNVVDFYLRNHLSCEYFLVINFLEGAILLIKKLWSAAADIC